MYKIYFKPTLTYVAETVTLTNTEKSRIREVDMTFLRGILGKTRRDGMKNVQIMEKLRIHSLVGELEDSKICCCGLFKSDIQRLHR